MAMALTPRIIPGAIHPANRSACDWGWQGFLAYGCQNYVVVVDPKTVQTIQTVHHHLAPICQVKWAQENYYHDLHSPYDLQLASANTLGYIMVWDVQQGKLLNEFAELNKLPLCLEWLKGYEVSPDLLLVLYSPNIMVLWNADTGVKLWRKQFQDNIVSFTVDPFNSSNMVVMSSDWIMLVTDLSINQTPSEKGRRFYMSTNTSPSSSSTSLPSSSSSAMKASSSKSTIQKVMSLARDFRGRGEDEIDCVSDCIQVVFLPSNKNLLLLLFPREVLILDVEIGQALGSFSIEATSPSFFAVIPCWQRDVLYLLHENGSVSMRTVRSPSSVPYQSSDDPEQMLSSRISLDILYDMRCHSDVFRLSRASRLMGFALDPISECEISILLGDGRILFWSLATQSGLNTADNKPATNQILHDLQATAKNSQAKHNTLTEMIPSLLSFSVDKDKNSLFRPKFMLTGMFEGVSLNPVCCRMCPPMTTKNFNMYKPFLAVGCSNGVLQIFNASKGCLVKYFSMMCHNIKGLEWITLTTLIVFFQGSSSTNKSELVYVDVDSGVNTTLPSSRGLKESTVVSLKVSHLKQYFLVLFKNQSAELWDASNLCQLREFPQKFPTITAFEWSPSNYGSKLGKKKAKPMNSDDGSNKNITNLDESTSTILDTKQNDHQKIPAKTKEHLVFTDGDGTVYHYVVEGTSLKDGSKVPPEAGMSAISYIAWKADMLVLGDVDGNLNLWDLKGKVSRVFPTHRGCVKRMKFAPGKGNLRMIILFNDGIEVWDTVEAKVLGTIKTAKDQISIVDADWLASSLPVLLPSDGSIRILDGALKSSNSSVMDKELDEAVFNPRLIEPEANMKLKHILQYQPWREVYDCENFSEAREDRPVQDLLRVIPSDIADKLYDCPLGTAERCFCVSQIFGDESDCLFWTVAMHYLQRERSRKACQQHGDKNKSEEEAGGLSRLSSSNSLDDFLLDSDIDEATPTEVLNCSCMKKSLDAKFDILCDNVYYKKLQLYRIALRDSHRSTYDHTHWCAAKLILTGEMDRAVQILLEAEPSDTNYYTDALRAITIATVRSSGPSQSTIKLVATNLIAGGKLSEGVELLCLVEKGLDACRYLQTYGSWDDAAWLAKVRLNHHDCMEVLSRWSEQLCAVNKKVVAILVLLSFGKFIKVLELMFSLGQIERATLFLQACVEFGVVSLADSANITLFENIYLDFARLQFKLKNKQTAEFYCSKAGGRGRKLMEDFEKGLLNL